MCRFDFHTCFFFVYVVDSGKKSDRVILINSLLIVSSSRSARALFKFSSYGQFGNAMKHAVTESFKLIKLIRLKETSAASLAQALKVGDR